MQQISHVIQPIYSHSGQILFAEVLARFPGQNTQEAVIEAEKTGKIIDIDIAGFEYAKRSPLSSSVNISGRTISEGLRGVAKHIRPGMVVEITETYPSDLQKIKTMAFEVHGRGGCIAIDDVGCGSFADLDWVSRLIKEIHPKWIKFNINSCPEVIDFVSKSKKSLVAERIENEDDIQKAVGMNANGLQGWFFDGPRGAAWLYSKRAESVLSKIGRVSTAMAF